MENNLADALAMHARTRPDHLALVDGARRLTHAELYIQVLALAYKLTSQGFAAGSIVGLCLRDSLESVVCMWACARAGMVLLPLDWRWTMSERDAVIRHFKAICVITEPDIALSACPTVTWQKLQDCQTATSQANLPVTTLDSPLLISLSSGTTGRPKGPVVTHRHFLRRFWTHWINLGLNANSRFICATPLYFGGGRTLTLSVIFSGGTAILHAPPFAPESLAQSVRQHNADALFLVPTQLRRLLDSPVETRQSFQQLKLLISSGAPLQPNERTAIRLNLCHGLHEYYASTEGGGISLCTPEDYDKHLTSVGRPVYAVEVEVVNDEDQPLKAGQVGHLRYRGPGVADEFFNDVEQTQEHFRSGWFYPGDLAEKDVQGYIYLRGRSKDVVNRGGIKIYPNEIEDTLMQLPKLRECCVIGRPDPMLGESLACAWVGDAAMDQTELASYCSTHLAPYKMPSSWLRLDELPRNSAGKVVKDKLRGLTGWATNTTEARFGNR